MTRFCSLSKQRSKHSNTAKNHIKVERQYPNAKEDVYNANKTGLNRRGLPEKSLAFQLEVRTLGFKTSKEQVITLAVQMLVDRKVVLKLFVATDPFHCTQTTANPFKLIYGSPVEN